MQITIIAAVAQNRAIGKDNKLIYWLPNDLKRFKALTTGHTIIMGRKTFESLPKGALPNRRNIVLSRSKRDFAGCDCYTSLDEALANCSADEDIYIIGGASIYEQAINSAQRGCNLTGRHAARLRAGRVQRRAARIRKEHRQQGKQPLPGRMEGKEQSCA